MKLENPEEGRFTFFSGKGRILHREQPQTHTGRKNGFAPYLRSANVSKSGPKP